MGFTRQQGIKALKATVRKFTVKTLWKKRKMNVWMRLMGMEKDNAQERDKVKDENKELDR